MLRRVTSAAQGRVQGHSVAIVSSAPPRVVVKVIRGQRFDRLHVLRAARGRAAVSVGKMFLFDL